MLISNAVRLRFGKRMYQSCGFCETGYSKSQPSHSRCSLWWRTGEPGRYSNRKEDYRYYYPGLTINFTTLSSKTIFDLYRKKAASRVSRFVLTSATQNRKKLSRSTVFKLDSGSSGGRLLLVYPRKDTPSNILPVALAFQEDKLYVASNLTSK